MAVFAIQSPNGRVKLNVTLEDGRLHWSAQKDSVAIVDKSPLGLNLKQGDLYEHLTLQREVSSTVEEDYIIPVFKKKHCYNHANALTLTLEKQEDVLTVEARAYDDGVAVRLIADGEGECDVERERTGFAIPRTAGQVYAMKYVFSYEDHYHPVPPCDMAQNTYAFPVLVGCGVGIWALYAEAAVFGD